MQNAPTVFLSEFGHHATLLTIRDPASGNTLSIDTIARLSEAVGRASQDRLLIIRGNVDVFCTSPEIHDHDDDGLEAQAEFNRAFYRLLDRVADFSMPTMAAINGAAFGCGLELALTCDLRIASATAIFGLDNDLHPVGKSRSRRLKFSTPLSGRLLAGRKRISADEALASGDLAEVVAKSDFDKHIEKIAGEISAMQPADLRRMKSLLRSPRTPTPVGRRRCPSRSASFSFNKTPWPPGA